MFLVVHIIVNWASVVAQLVKNPPAMREIWVQSLGWGGPLEKGTATHSSILAWRIPWTVFHGVSKSRTQLSDFHFTSSFCSSCCLSPNLPWAPPLPAGRGHSSLMLEPPPTRAAGSGDPQTQAAEDTGAGVGCGVGRRPVHASGVYSLELKDLLKALEL